MKDIQPFELFLRWRRQDLSVIANRHHWNVSFDLSAVDSLRCERSLPAILAILCYSKTPDSYLKSADPRMSKTINKIVN